MAATTGARSGFGARPAERNVNAGLRYTAAGYILENGDVVAATASAAAPDDEDVEECHLGLSSAGRRSARVNPSHKHRQ